MPDYLTVQPANSGIHLLGRFTPGVSSRWRDEEVSRIASKCDVIAPPLSRFYADRRNGSALVLGYAAANERMIVNATKRLAQALETNRFH